MIFKFRCIMMFPICLMFHTFAVMSETTAEAGVPSSSVDANESTPLPGMVPFPRPDSHRGNWTEFHGASANLNINEAGQMGKSCLTCHERNDCITCHNTRLPRDHTNTWRTLSHGFMAEGNRERCMTCHKQDYCVRCHNETAPRTHVGNWRERHCAWCHFGSGLVSADNCAVCHKSAPHTSAPHPVSQSLNCALCHR